MRVIAASVARRAGRVVGRFVAHNNGERLHSALGYITPNDFLAGRSKEIWAARDKQLEAARETLRQLRDLKVTA